MVCLQPSRCAFKIHLLMARVPRMAFQGLPRTLGSNSACVLQASQGNDGNGSRAGQRTLGQSFLPEKFRRGFLWILTTISTTSKVDVYTEERRYDSIFFSGLLPLKIVMETWGGGENRYGTRNRVCRLWNKVDPYLIFNPLLISVYLSIKAWKLMIRGNVFQRIK